MKHKMFKLGVMAAAFTVMGVQGIRSDAGWTEDSQGWHYTEDSSGKSAAGWEKIEDSWYFFNQNGILQTGWFQDGRSWYYSDSDGRWIEGYKDASGSQTGSGPSDSRHTREYEDKEYAIYLKSGNREVVTGYFVEDMEEEAFQLLNEYRKQNGLNELKQNEQLDKNALIRGYEISHSFRHNRPDRTSVLDMEGVYGENIAYGYPTAKELMDAWIASPSHNDNMLKAAYKTGAIKIFAKREFYSEGFYYVYYAVQLFGI